MQGKEAPTKRPLQADPTNELWDSSDDEPISRLASKKRSGRSKKRAKQEDHRQLEPEDTGTSPSTPHSQTRLKTQSELKKEAADMLKGKKKGRTLAESIRQIQGKRVAGLEDGEESVEYRLKKKKLLGKTCILLREMANHFVSVVLGLDKLEDLMYFCQAFVGQLESTENALVLEHLLVAGHSDFAASISGAMERFIEKRVCTEAGFVNLLPDNPASPVDAASQEAMMHKMCKTLDNAYQTFDGRSSMDAEVAAIKCIGKCGKWLQENNARPAFAPEFRFIPAMDEDSFFCGLSTPTSSLPWYGLKMLNYVLTQFEEHCSALPAGKADNNSSYNYWQAKQRKKLIFTARMRLLGPGESWSGALFGEETKEVIGGLIKGLDCRAFRPQFSSTTFENLGFALLEPLEWVAPQLMASLKEAGVTPEHLLEKQPSEQLQRLAVYSSMWPRSTATYSLLTQLTNYLGRKDYLKLETPWVSPVPVGTTVTGLVLLMMDCIRLREASLRGVDNEQERKKITQAIICVGINLPYFFEPTMLGLLNSYGLVMLEEVESKDRPQYGESDTTHALTRSIVKQVCHLHGDLCDSIYQQMQTTHMRVWGCITDYNRLQSEIAHAIEHLLPVWLVEWHSKQINPIDGLLRVLRNLEEHGVRLNSGKHDMLTEIENGSPEAEFFQLLNNRLRRTPGNMMFHGTSGNVSVVATRTRYDPHLTGGGNFGRRIYRELQTRLGDEAWQGVSHIEIRAPKHTDEPPHNPLSQTGLNVYNDCILSVYVVHYEVSPARIFAHIAPPVHEDARRPIFSPRPNMSAVQTLATLLPNSIISVRAMECATEGAKVTDQEIMAALRKAHNSPILAPQHKRKLGSLMPVAEAAYEADLEGQNHLSQYLIPVMAMVGHIDGFPLQKSDMNLTQQLATNVTGSRNSITSLAIHCTDGTVAHVPQPADSTWRELAAEAEGPLAACDIGLTAEQEGMLKRISNYLATGNQPSDAAKVADYVSFMDYAQFPENVMMSLMVRWGSKRSEDYLDQILGDRQNPTINPLVAKAEMGKLPVLELDDVIDLVLGIVAWPCKDIDFCEACGHMLTDEVSMAFGLGPDCRKRRAQAEREAEAAFLQAAPAESAMAAIMEIDESDEAEDGTDDGSDESDEEEEPELTDAESSSEEESGEEESESDSE